MFKTHITFISFGNLKVLFVGGIQPKASTRGITALQEVRAFVLHRLVIICF